MTKNLWSGLLGILVSEAASAQLIVPESHRTVVMRPLELDFPATASDKEVVLPGPVWIGLLYDGEGAFLGLGRIEIRGLVVRSGKTPMGPAVEGRTPHVYTACHLRRAAPNADGQSVTLATELVAEDGTTDQLDWVLQAEQIDFLGQPAVGFSYAYAFRSPTREVHFLTDHSTWSLGGSVDGCLYLEQVEPYGQQPRCFVIGPETAIPARTPLPHRISPESRPGTGSRLDFLGVANASLIRFIREPALTFNEITLSPRPRGAAGGSEEPGDREIAATEKWATPLSREFRTEPMTVLLHPAGGVQAWLDAHHVVARLQHRAANLYPTPPLPMTQQGDLPHTTEFLERCREYGFRRVWVWSRWQTNWSEWDHLSSEQQQGLRTPQPLSHAVLRLDWASKYNVDELREYALAAPRYGVELYFWFPTSHLSSISPWLEEHPDWIVQRRDGSRYDYAYPDIQGVFHPAGYGAYALARLERLRQEVPFHGLFFDSFQTFGLDVIHYGHPRWANQFQEILAFARTLQARGLGLYVEAITPWLQSCASGLWRQELEGREFMLYGTAPHLGAQTMSAESYFRALAFQAAPVIRIEFWDEDEALRQLGTYANKAFAQVASQMGRCRLLPGGRGTLWEDRTGQPAVLFSFDGGRVDLKELGVKGTSEAREVLSDLSPSLVKGGTGGVTRVPVERGVVHLEPYQVYRLISQEEKTPLREIWRVPLNLHNPSNVVLGRLGSEAYFCVQGARKDGGSAAAVEVRDARGRLVWEDTYREPDLDYDAGAYVHWIAGPGLEEPLVLYAFVPQSDERRGGARLLRARDGGLIGEIENTTRFGNNNALVADLDGDGRLELVYADQRTLTCYDLPSCQPRWRYQDGVLFCWSLPALVDLNADGRPEIVFGSEYNNPDGTSSMVALNAEGQQVWRSDGHLEDLGSTPVFVADVDGDGETELLKVGLDLEHRRNQTWNHLHLFDFQGRLKAKIALGFTGIALGDLDGDGHLEGVGLTNARDGGPKSPQLRLHQRAARCLDLATGEVKWTCPVPRAYLDTNSPLLADVNGDGQLEAVVGTGNPAGYGRLPDSEPWGDVYVLDGRGKILQRLSLPGWPVNFAWGDVNDDGLGELAIVINGAPGWLALYQTQAPTQRKDWPTPFGSARRDGTMGALADRL